MAEQSAKTDTKALLGSASRFAKAFTDFAGKRVWWAAALVGAGGLLEGASLALLIPVIHILTSLGAGGRLQAAVIVPLGAIGANTPGQRLGVLLTVFVGLMLARTTLLYRRDALLDDLQASFVEETRNGLVRRLASAQWSQVGSLRHARITSLNTDIQRVGAGAQFVIQGSVALGTLLMLAILAFILSPKMLIAAAMITVGSGVVMAINVRGALRAGRELSRGSLVLGGLTANFLDGLKTAVAQNAQGDFVREFQAAQAGIRARRQGRAGGQNRNRLALGLVTTLAGAAVIWVGFHDLAGRPAVLITLILVFARMTGPVVQMYQTTEKFFLSLPAFEALTALEASLHTERGPTHPAASLPDGPLELREAGFLHPDAGGLRPASLVLAPGVFLGVTGPSGAGKTTLVDLLCGLLEPQTGAVSVGGQRLDQAHMAAWREGIAYVGQEPYLFHDSLRRNLTWGTDLPDEAAIWRALEAVGAGDLVRGMKDGLETIVGVRGARLSGGERQRIAIARGLLRHPRLLILDEATNAIDIAGEATLLSGLKTLDPAPTIIMIAHRAESLVHCDEVVSLSGGRLSASVRRNGAHSDI